VLIDMVTSLWIVALITSGLLSGVLVRTTWKSKSKVFKRWGGVALGVTFLLGVVLLIFRINLELTFQIRGILLGTVLILFFGLSDDWRDWNWKIQLAFQVFLGILLLGFGFGIDYVSDPWQGVWRLDQALFSLEGQFVITVGSLLVIIWTVVIINAYNWLDGIDGLAGGIGILGAIALVAVSLRPEVNQVSVALLSLILAGAILGFWAWNFSLGKIQMGSSGSYLIAFLLAALALISGTKIATTLAVLALPILDFVWVIGERLRSGASPFQKEVGQRHLHYRLRQLGWKDWQIVGSYLAFTGLAVVISLSDISRLEKFTFLVIEFGVAWVVLWLVSRKIKAAIKNNSSS
jgi:UDP-GlcNAc:undecaprenyl-phosphate GlcNAc-1-phosphate transferase